MASSNLVRVAFIEESTLGVTPAAGNFSTVRFISEGLSGSPETTESQQIRVDRLSSGQIVTGLTIGGDISFEASKEAALESFMESAFFNTFVSDTPVSADLTIDTTAETLTRATGDWNTDVEVGDFIQLTGFVDSANNTQVMIAAINSATEARIVFPDTLVDEVATGTSFNVGDKLTIGTTKKSFSIEKVFTDLTDKAIVYKGMIAGQMNLSVTYGEIVNGSFTFSGTEYTPVSASADFITDGRTIDSAATTQSLNGSIDMPFISSSAAGTLTEADFCIQSVELTLNNNLTAQTCIGRSGPQDYSEGTAQVEVSLTAYLANQNWDFLPKKLTQESFALGFILKNSDGAYAFYLPAVQVSGDDPASPGANQDVFLNLSGTGKVSSTGGSSIRVYRFA